MILLTKTMAIELAAARHPRQLRVRRATWTRAGWRSTAAPTPPSWPTSRRRSRSDGSARIEEIANLFVFLATDESPYINGESIVIDGGHLARQA